MGAKDVDFSTLWFFMACIASMYLWTELCGIVELHVIIIMLTSVVAHDQARVRHDTLLGL
jgi:uncharacterized membrane protein YhaH (DUF805 family)